MSAQVLTYLPTFKEAAVFRLQVLNKDADQIEKRLHELEKTFYKAFDKYHTTFINKAPTIEFPSNHLTTWFITHTNLKVATLVTDLHRIALFIDKAGNVRKLQIQKPKLDWQLQSERAAKIELYALTGIDKEHWVL